MAADAGSTTVTEASSPQSSMAAQALTLAWQFPRPFETPLTSRTLPGEWVLGRDDSCAVRLTGEAASRRHAALRQQVPHGPVELVDLGSRNGVRVNGRKVDAAVLNAGDVVALGGWVGVVTAFPGPFQALAPGLFGAARLAASIQPLARAAPSALPIVLQGETGTGKEVVARTIHSWSGRRGPLVAVNCATLPDGLAEAELFGYRRGAFTGADRSSQGLFRSADGGTLLLDEVLDLPLGVQAKLLRVLEQREVLPLGETRPVPVDVRLVVAGQQSLSEAVQEGRFRADLLSRLDGLTVILPPLRKRREDVPALFSRFLNERTGGRAPAVEADLIESLCLHDWPFNVRELVLLVQRLLVLHPDESTLALRHLPERMTQPAAESASSPRAAPAPKSSAPAGPVELPALLVALRAAAGNVARASAMLGITRQRAYRLMEEYAVDLQALRGQEETRR